MIGKSSSSSVACGVRTIVMYVELLLHIVVVGRRIVRNKKRSSGLVTQIVAAGRGRGARRALIARVAFSLVVVLHRIMNTQTSFGCIGRVASSVCHGPEGGVA